MLECDADGFTSAVGEGFVVLFPPEADARAVRRLGESVAAVRYRGCSSNGLVGAVKSAIEADSSLKPRERCGAAVVVETGDAVVLLALGASTVASSGTKSDGAQSNLLWRIPTDTAVSGDSYVLEVPAPPARSGRVVARMM
jgi:hypothetical protein